MKKNILSDNLDNEYCDPSDVEPDRVESLNDLCKQKNPRVFMFSIKLYSDEDDIVPLGAHISSMYFSAHMKSGHIFSYIQRLNKN